MSRFHTYQSEAGALEVSEFVRQRSIWKRSEPRAYDRMGGVKLLSLSSMLVELFGSGRAHSNCHDLSDIESVQRRPIKPRQVGPLESLIQRSRQRMNSHRALPEF